MLIRSSDVAPYPLRIVSASFPFYYLFTFVSFIFSVLPVRTRPVDAARYSARSAPRRKQRNDGIGSCEPNAPCNVLFAFARQVLRISSILPLLLFASLLSFSLQCHGKCYAAPWGRAFNSIPRCKYSSRSEFLASSPNSAEIL